VTRNGLDATRDPEIGDASFSLTCVPADHLPGVCTLAPALQLVANTMS